MIVLVTGGCGFIGRDLTRRLNQIGHSVIVFDNLSTGTVASIDNCDVDIVEGDVRDPASVNAVVRRADAVIHLAAQTGVGPSIENPLWDHEVNVGGTLNLLQASKLARVQRFIFASSGAALGSATPPMRETTTPMPISPYGASKLAGEAYCSAFNHSFGVPTVVLRMANIYGPGSGHKQSVVARFVQEGLQSRQLTIYGDGCQTRDLIYVGDVSDAIARALEVEEACGQLMHVATGRETAILDLAHLVREALGNPQPHLRFLPPREGEVRRNFADITRAREILDWNPKVSLQDGILQTCAWFMEQGESVRR